MTSHPDCQKCKADAKELKAEIERLARKFKEVHNLVSLERFADEVGSKYFEAGNKRFFNSRVSEPYIGKTSIFLVDSTKYRNEPRRYSVKRAYMEGTDLCFEGIGEFQAYSTSKAAHREAAKARNADTTGALS
jgi:hypothetical protein